MVFDILCRGNSAPEAVEQVFREESGKILATLIRFLGDFDQAEEAMQDGLATALERWPKDGVPNNPAEGVLVVIYLIFNEGYSASFGSELVRRPLCAEATRLGRVLYELMPDEPEVIGLLALMLLQDSRRDARVGPRGELIVLEEQNRELWDREQIVEGQSLLERALRMGRPRPYQVQAAIAALHAEAGHPDETDWHQIAALYGTLSQMTPSPIVELNRAVAVAMSQGVEQGLVLIDLLGASGDLDGYYYYHAARADLLRRLNKSAEAVQAYQRAKGLTGNQSELAYLERRLVEIA